MNGFLVCFLLVSIFAYNAFCTRYPSYFGLWSPPPPEGIEFGGCFITHEITGGNLLTEVYVYYLICPQTLPDDGPQLPRHERNWFFVGRFRDSWELLPELPRLDYKPVERSLIKFVFLEETMIKFVTGSRDSEFKIIFKTIEQTREFYAIIYHAVNMSPAAPRKIGALHEIMTQDQQLKKIGSNVDALCEGINDFWHITFKNERGEPLLIFPATDAAIMRIAVSDLDRLQLLFRMHLKYYILTFLSCDEAKLFSNALLNFVALIYLKKVPADIRAHLENNRIAIDWHHV